MCVGEIRKLTVPAHLGYGEEGAGDMIPGANIIYPFINIIQQNLFISGGATTIFEVHLKSSEDGFKDAEDDVQSLLAAEANENGDVDNQGIMAALMNFVKDTLTKHKRGSFIQNGVKYKM